MLAGPSRIILFSCYHFLFYYSTCWEMPSILSTETSSDIFILNSSYLPFYQKHEMFLLNGTGNFIMIKAGSHKNYNRVTNIWNKKWQKEGRNRQFHSYIRRL
jgi:hypothetical protein